MSPPRSRSPQASACHHECGKDTRMLCMRSAAGTCSAAANLEPNKGPPRDKTGAIILVRCKTNSPERATRSVLIF
eukprot:2999992-Pleurochrysis_carterae.AAC.1